jgi:hypothetical protein
MIAGPGCWPSRKQAVAALTGCGCRAVISVELDDDVRNDLIDARILVIALSSETITKLLDTVDADPGIVLTVDARQGEVRARGELLARFEIGQRSAQRRREPASEPDRQAHGGGAIAGRLLMAQRLLGSASLPGDVRMRLQRRLVAISDAMKAPRADAARAARRLDRLLSDLVMISLPESGPARDGRAPTPPGATRGSRPP